MATNPKTRLLALGCEVGNTAYRLYNYNNWEQPSKKSSWKSQHQGEFVCQPFWIR